MNDQIIELQALISEREGMISENLQRQIQNQSLAYTDEAFRENAKQIRALENKNSLEIANCFRKSIDEINMSISIMKPDSQIRAGLALALQIIIKHTRLI